MLTRIHCLMNSLFKNKTEPEIHREDTWRQTTVAQLARVNSWPVSKTPSFSAQILQ